MGLIILGLIYLSIEGLALYQGLLLIAGLIGILVPFLDLLAMAFGQHIGTLRKIRYFVMMNIALLTGFFRYVKGIQNGFWEPPKRV